MKNRKLIIVFSLILLPIIVYLSGIAYINYSIYKSDKEFFHKWQKKEFFANEYIMVVLQFYKIPYQNSYQEYIDVYYLSKNNEIRTNNLILQNIHKLQKGDTLIKPKDSYDLFLIKNKQKIKLDYKWSWEKVMFQS